LLSGLLDSLLDSLLGSLPSFTPDHQAKLELPFTLGELQSAVKAPAASKAHGLDSLSYEFYKATFGMVDLPLLDDLNAMLNRGLLSPSLGLGVVRLLTKMFVARLLPLLPGAAGVVWPPSAARSDVAVVLAVTTFTTWAWAIMSSLLVLAPHVLQARVFRTAPFSPSSK
jgi:hypothetical protein